MTAVERRHAVSDTVCRMMILVFCVINNRRRSHTCWSAAPLRGCSGSASCKKSAGSLLHQTALRLALWTGGLGRGKCFDTLVVLISWLIWKERNRTFDHHSRSPDELLALVEDDIALWCRAGHSARKHHACFWSRHEHRVIVSPYLGSLGRVSFLRNHLRLL
jgi:hypothetical protein